MKLHKEPRVFKARASEVVNPEKERVHTFHPLVDVNPVVWQEAEALARNLSDRLMAYGFRIGLLAAVDPKISQAFSSRPEQLNDVVRYMRSQISTGGGAYDQLDDVGNISNLHPSLRSQVQLLLKPHMPAVLNEIKRGKRRPMFVLENLSKARALIQLMPGEREAIQDEVGVDEERQEFLDELSKFVGHPATVSAEFKFAGELLLLFPELALDIRQIVAEDWESIKRQIQSVPDLQKVDQRYEDIFYASVLAADVAEIGADGNLQIEFKPELGQGRKLPERSQV